MHKTLWWVAYGVVEDRKTERTLIWTSYVCEQWLSVVIVVTLSLSLSLSLCTCAVKVILNVSLIIVGGWVGT